MLRNEKPKKYQFFDDLALKNYMSPKIMLPSHFFATN